MVRQEYKVKKRCWEWNLHCRLGLGAIMKVMWWHPKLRPTRGNWHELLNLKCKRCMPAFDVGYMWLRHASTKTNSICSRYVCPKLNRIARGAR
jgi:hypothetical protein